MPNVQPSVAGIKIGSTGVFTSTPKNIEDGTLPLPLGTSFSWQVPGSEHVVTLTPSFDGTTASISVPNDPTLVGTVITLSLSITVSSPSPELYAQGVGVTILAADAVPDDRITAFIISQTS